MNDQELEKILQDFRDELGDLRNRRREKSIRRSQMTEEELIKDLEMEYREVLEDASEQGVTVGIVPGEDESDDEDEE